MVASREYGCSLKISGNVIWFACGRRNGDSAARSLPRTSCVRAPGSRYAYGDGDGPGAASILRCSSRAVVGNKDGSHGVLQALVVKRRVAGRDDESFLGLVVQASPSPCALSIAAHSRSIWHGSVERDVPTQRPVPKRFAIVGIVALPRKPAIQIALHRPSHPRFHTAILFRSAAMQVFCLSNHVSIFRVIRTGVFLLSPLFYDVNGSSCRASKHPKEIRDPQQIISGLAAGPDLLRQAQNSRMCEVLNSKVICLILSQTPHVLRTEIVRCTGILNHFAYIFMF